MSSISRTHELKQSSFICILVNCSWDKKAHLVVNMWQRRLQMVQWGLIFSFYISTKWLSYRNIALPTAEICHHGNLLSLEGWDALGKYVATTSEIITQTEFHLSSLSLTSVWFLCTGHCSHNHIRERLYVFKYFSFFERSSVWDSFLPYSTGIIVLWLQLQTSLALQRLLDHALLWYLQYHPLLLGKSRNPEGEPQQFSDGKHTVNLLTSIYT